MAEDYPFRPAPQNILLRRNRGLHAGERLAVIPRQPFGRLAREVRRMLLQRGEVVEGVRAIQFASVDQAHEQIADPSSVGRPVEHGVLAI